MKLLTCPCVNAKYCGTMISSTRLHRAMYNHKFGEFIHSKKGLNYLIEHYDGKISVLKAIENAYKDLQ